MFNCLLVKKNIFKLKVIRTWFQLKKRVTNDVTRLCEHVCWSKKMENDKKNPRLLTDGIYERRTLTISVCNSFR